VRGVFADRDYEAKDRIATVPFSIVIWLNHSRADGYPSPAVRHPPLAEAHPLCFAPSNSNLMERIHRAIGSSPSAPVRASLCRNSAMRGLLAFVHVLAGPCVQADHSYAQNGLQRHISGLVGESAKPGRSLVPQSIGRRLPGHPTVEVDGAPLVGVFEN
jgi:hypothetical protein